jgi:hypothetical protein
VTIHTFTGADPNDPTNWGSAQNWDTQKVPQDGDRVVIDGDRVTNVPADRSFSGVTIRNGAHLDSGGPLSTSSLTAGCAFSDVSIFVTEGGGATVYGLDLREGAILTNHGVLAVAASPPPLGQECTTDIAGHQGKLRLFPGSRLDNWGMLGGSGTVLGMSCCTEPQELRNFRSGSILADASGLVLDSLRLVNKGELGGAGNVVLDGAPSTFANWGRVTGRVVLAGGTTLTVSRTTTVNGTVDQEDATVVGPIGAGATLDGTGTWTILGGSLNGALTFGEDLHFETAGPAMKSIATSPVPASDTQIIVAGPALLGGTGSLRLAGSLDRITFGGTTRFLGMTIDARSCCTTPSRLRFDGPVQVKASAGTSRIFNVRVSFWDRVDLNGGELEVSPESITLGNVSTTTLALEGGRLIVGGGAELLVPADAELVGPGVVEVPTLRLKGWARNDPRGQLTVDGSLVVGDTANLFLRFTDTKRDRVSVTGLAQLDGTLQLRGASVLPRGYRFLTADERLGRFSSLAGVPAGRTVVYGDTYVALR